MPPTITRADVARLAQDERFAATLDPPHIVQLAQHFLDALEFLRWSLDKDANHCCGRYERERARSQDSPLTAYWNGCHLTALMHEAHLRNLLKDYGVKGGKCAVYIRSRPVPDGDAVEERGRSGGA